MMRTIMLAVVTFVALMFTVACGEYREPVVSYCDRDIYYSLWQRSQGFHLHLEVGRETERFCAVTPRGVRDISLIETVPSKEEGMRLVDEYRKKISGRTQPSPVKHVSKVAPTQQSGVLSRYMCLLWDGK